MSRKEINKRAANYRKKFMKENYESFTFRFSKENDSDVIQYIKDYGINGVRSAIRYDCMYTEMNGGNKHE